MPSSACVAPTAALQCAVLPLQLLGFDVDPVNSVQFSNHTGYPSWQGDVMSGEQLWRLVEGLEANQLCGRYTHLLTGAYCPGRLHLGRFKHLCAARQAGRHCCVTSKASLRPYCLLPASRPCCSPVACLLLSTAPLLLSAAFLLLP